MHGGLCAARNSLWAGDITERDHHRQILWASPTLFLSSPSLSSPAGVLEMPGRSYLTRNRAFFASAMVSNSPGTIVDITEPDYLALAMSCWSIAPLNGPVTGPLIGGFVFQYLGWRWDNSAGSHLRQCCVPGHVPSGRRTRRPFFKERQQDSARSWTTSDTGLDSDNRISTWSS